MRHEEPSEDPATDTTADSGYGRARLCVGISAVGSWVLMAAAGLTFGGPRWFADAWSGRIGGGVGGEAFALLMFVVVYVAVQLPFDLLGGLMLPRGYRRAAPAWGAYVKGWSRGVAVHGAMLFAVAGVLTVAGHYGGPLLMFVAAVGGSLVLLAQRLGLARALASVRPAAVSPGLAPDSELPHALRRRGGRGLHRGGGRRLPPAGQRFAGGLGARPWAKPACESPRHGGRRPRPPGRGAAAGCWRWASRGSVSPSPPCASESADLRPWARPPAPIAFSLWFTLWSFLGLLVLPTFSRRGVAEVDARLLAEGTTPDELNAITRTLDRRQDSEPARPGWVERIFHPIPSVNNREAPTGGTPPRGAWDAARTAVFVSAAGLGLLGRAVHCNCGRPALWAFLPTE